MGAQQSQRDYSYIKDGVKPKMKEEREEVPIWARSNRKSLKKAEEFVRRCHVEVADFDFRQVVEGNATEPMQTFHCGEWQNIDNLDIVQ